MRSSRPYRPEGRARSRPDTPERAPGLIRGLGTSAATAIVLGTMIGTGIFLKPSEMAAESGSLALFFAALIIGGVLSLFGALCYIELGTAIPEAGGEYVYLRRGFGAVWGFLFGWMHSTVARPSSVAAIAAGLLRFCSFFFPVLMAPVPIFHHLAITWQQPVAVVALIAITYVNYLGVKVGGRVQVVLTAAKVAVVIAVIAGGFLLVHKPAQNMNALWPSEFNWATMRGFLAALAAVLWAYDGWNDLNLVGSEVEDPARNFPRVILRSVLFVIVIFVLFSAVCFYALPFQAVAASQHVTSDVFASFAGRTAALWLTLAMGVSALGTLNASVLSGARVDYAMARDGLFFRFAAAVHPKFRTPGNALVFQCVVGSAMALTGTFEDLTSLVMFGSWIFYGLAVVAMMRMRRTEPDLPRPYRTWGYPVVPVVFVACAFTVSASLWMARPVRSSIGLVLILSGLIFYRYWRQRQRGALRSSSRV